MAIKVGKIVVSDRPNDPKTLMQDRNISLVEKVSREKATPIKTKSAKITVTESGVEKTVYKTSKYLDDLTNKGE